MGNLVTRPRAASVALDASVSSPTHSDAGSDRDHSPILSPASGPQSPAHAPITLSLPPTLASTALLSEKHPDSGSSSDEEHQLEEGGLRKKLAGDFDAKAPQLSFCGLVRANVAAAYTSFAESKVGLFTRAFVMSLPQSLALSASLGFAFSGLVTPIVMRKGDNAHIQNYFLFAVIASLGVSALTTFYDTFHRLKSHFHQGNYNSFGIFHLRATFMGAALGDSALRTIMYDLAQSKNIWLNFSLTLPATFIPAYVRYVTFKHDMVPSKLDQKDKDSPPLQQDEKKKVFLKSRFFSVATAPFLSAASWLLLYRAIQTDMLKTDYKPFTTTKILSIIIPSVIGLAAKFFEASYPNIAYRWKQLDVLVGDAAMIFICLAGSFPNPSNEFEAPNYWWGPLAITAFLCSLSLAAIQASRVKIPEQKEEISSSSTFKRSMSTGR